MNEKPINEQTMIRLAIQKAGRLSEGTLRLLGDCGLTVSSGNNKLIAKANGFPAEILFLRDDDIPQYVEDGVADVGILGKNVVTEKSKNVHELMSLGFSRCRLSLAVSKNSDYNGLDWFNGKSIATSYPRILKNFLQENKIDASIHEISGSVEIAPGIGLAEGICDIVSSGSTLLSNGLRETDVVFRSEAVLVSGTKINQQKQDLINKLMFRIRAVRESKSNKYILLNAPNEKLDAIIRILPGMKAPTVLPLAKEGWSSLHSVIGENQFWEVIDHLKDAGAEGILVVPIEKMVL
jgi:ATP phosphoribosyltransferase